MGAMTAGVRCASPPAKPLMIYDGQCPLCRRWIARWAVATGSSVEYRPYQHVADRFPEIGLKQFQQAVYLIEPDGSRTSAAAAVFRALALAGRYRWLAWAYDHLPGFGRLAELAYRFVAQHRAELDRLERAVFPGAIARA